MFQELIKYFGSRKALCEELGITRQAFWQFQNKGYFPAARAIEIEIKTKGKFKAVNLYS
tara:strand:- start:52 stop:228 length:177 start_codon:yes stop_codon:yes gene_type:complete